MALRIGNSQVIDGRIRSCSSGTRQLLRALRWYGVTGFVRDGVEAPAVVLAAPPVLRAAALAATQGAAGSV
ncbi:hypothetical protein [Ramlibacter alkalitolerans]|uniref:DUF4224 domain-containing protein n=1 Tax=Ramlibacter alkalitolerans TaxID=2039631 RepID=A0ABS1JML9_9BURK|nr:hypothetical protein [Ramlibacter alkalitolerans]MBL0425485.1 hypothetical protein [Ramlibacter alkalitolerans]